MDSLGTRLRRFRLRSGLSKRMVAARLGVSIPSIMRWEDGASEPNDYNKYKIERLLEGTPPRVTNFFPPNERIVQLELFGDRGA